MNVWTWAGLVLYLGWVGFTFGLRAVQQRRRTGDAGFRGTSGRPGTAPWWAGVLFTVALLGGAAAPTTALFGFPALPGVGGGVLHWAALLVILAGIVLTVVAQTTMGSSWRVGVDAEERTILVTGGLFACMRNPVFTAMTVTAVGLTLLVPNLFAFLALATLVTAVQLQVRVVEEPYLAAVHADVYAAYTAQAGRFLPGIGRRSA